MDAVGAPYEIVVVDDGSTDSTLEEAMSVRGTPLKVIGYRNNRGKGFAIKYAAQYVTGDAVIFMDADKEVSAEQVGQYVRVLRDHDIAIASKHHPESKVSAPIMRRVLSHAFHCLVVLLTGVRVSDTQSGFKAFKRQAFIKVMGLLSVKHYAFDVEILTVARLLKLSVVELPIRIDLKGAFGARHVLRMLVDLAGIVYRLRVIRWYQENLDKDAAYYRAIIRW
jgi:glycosyltransferase involved in cell wall biosynthesis